RRRRKALVEVAHPRHEVAQGSHGDDIAERIGWIFRNDQTGGELDDEDLLGRTHRSIAIRPYARQLRSAVGAAEPTTSCRNF
ncbi:conserved hypothetical protein, partial [Ricinus communis]